MSKILRRPMFRGGPVDSYGTGIASGLGTRSGYFRGGGVSYNPFSQSQTQNLVQSYTPKGIPQPFVDFFKANQANQKPTGRFRKSPGATLQDAEGLYASLDTTPSGILRAGSAYGEPLSEEDIEESLKLGGIFENFGTASSIRRGEGEKLEPSSRIEKGLFGSGVFDESDSFRERKGEYGEADPASTSPELEAIRQQNIEEIDTSPKEIKKTRIEDDEPEVTMTDLEKALGLDRARQEYAADALAAASKAFFEGRGFEAIADAAQVKSKAPDIKRLAGLEEFKADRAEKLFDKKQKALREQKEGTKGAFQKKLETITSQKEGTQGHIIALAEQKLQPTIQGQIAALTSKNFVRPSPAEIKGLMIAYYPQSYSVGNVVGAEEEMAGKKAGTYITEDATTIIFWDGKKGTSQSI